MRISDWSSDVCSSDLTACATADIPADSQVAPTINCDPSSFEVEGDPTHVKELVSATPIGNGQWELVYGSDVPNPSTNDTNYDLADTPPFPHQTTHQPPEETDHTADCPLTNPTGEADRTRIV